MKPGGSPLYLANRAWDAVSVFFLCVLCLIALLSWRPGTFVVPFWPLRWNRQVPTPFSLGGRHLAGPPPPRAVLPALPLAPVSGLWSSSSCWVASSGLGGSARLPL